MSQRVHVVCSPPVAAGFRLSGVDVLAVGGAGPAAPPTSAEIVAAVQPLFGDPEVGIILIESGLYEALGAEVQRLERAAVPMVVPFPGPGPGLRGAAERTISDVLARAIGYRVRAS